MDASELYTLFSPSMSIEEVAELCRQILKASGNRAKVIWFAKHDGWWDDSVADPSQAILDAPGNRTWPIAYAKIEGWWLDPLMLEDESWSITKAEDVEKAMLHSFQSRKSTFQRLVLEAQQENRPFIIKLPFHSFGSSWSGVKFVVDAGYQVDPSPDTQHWVVRLPFHYLTEDRPNQSNRIPPTDDE